MSNIYLIGADIGSSTTNIAATILTAEGIKQPLISKPSQIKIGKPEQYADINTGAIKSSPAVEIQTPNGNVTYTIGESENNNLVHGETRLYDGTNTALLTAGLQHWLDVPKNSKIVLALSIPTNLFYIGEDDSKEVNKSLIEQIENAYYTQLIGYKVIDIKIVPEAQPPLFSYLINSNGSRKPEYIPDSKLLIVDIGGNTLDTTECLVPEVGQKIFTKLSMERAIPHSGVNGIKQRLEQKVLSAYKEKGVILEALNPAQIERAKRSGMVSINGVELDTKNFLKQAYVEQAKKIETNLMDIAKDGNYSKIIFSGGGSIVFKSFIKKWFKNTEITGPYACAEGLNLIAINMAKKIAVDNGYKGAKSSIQLAIQALEEIYG